MKKTLLAYLALVAAPGLHRVVLHRADGLRFPVALGVVPLGIALWTPDAVRIGFDAALAQIPMHALVVLALPFVVLWLHDFLTMWSWAKTNPQRAAAR